MDNYNLVISICVGISSVAFSILVIFLVLFFIRLMKTLKKVNAVLDDTEAVIDELYPIIHLIGRVGKFADSAVGFFTDEDDEQIDNPKQESRICGEKRRGDRNIIGGLIHTAQCALIAFNFFNKKKKYRWWRD